jgi:hypothetical protein
MTHRVLLLCLCCLLPWTARAAGPDSAIVGGQVLRGHFVQERHLKGFAAPLRTTGVFTLAPANGLIWRAETPFAVTTVISPSGLLQSLQGTETVRLPAARMPFLTRLYDMLGGALAGNWQSLEGDFSVTRIGTAAAWRVELQPRKTDDPAMPFRSITASGGRFIDKVAMIRSDGDEEDLAFVDQTLANGPLSAEEDHAFRSLTRAP